MNYTPGIRRLDLDQLEVAVRVKHRNLKPLPMHSCRSDDSE